MAAPAAAAGHACAALAAVLRCSQHEMQHGKALSRVLCLISALLPAASVSRASHATAAGLAAAHAAADAAVSACRCLVQLVTRAALPLAVVRDAVSEAAAYAQCSIAEAFAHALCCAPRAPRRLQTAAASALAALLAAGARATAVLVGQSGEEAYAPEDVEGASHDMRIGAALADGLLRIVTDAHAQDTADTARKPLTAIPSNRPQTLQGEPGRSKPASGASEAAAAARLALQPLLAFSPSAKALVLGHDAYGRWVRSALAACDALASKGPADEVRFLLHDCLATSCRRCKVHELMHLNRGFQGCIRRPTASRACRPSPARRRKPSTLPIRRRGATRYGATKRAPH